MGITAYAVINLVNLVVCLLETASKDIKKHGYITKQAPGPGPRGPMGAPKLQLHCVSVSL